MAMPFFVWKSIDSRNMHVVVNEYPPLYKPKERVTNITVPDRPGSLTILEGDENNRIYEPTVQVCQCTALPGVDIDALCAWLNGAGLVCFGCEPAYVHKARIGAQITLDKLLRGHAHKTFAIPFECQPGKYLYTPAAAITITQSGTVVHNPGNMAAEPQLLVTGSGAVTLITGTGGAVELDGGTGPWTILIDCEMKDCFNAARSGYLNDWMTGAFPLLPPGDNAISWTGSVSSIIITPNWRWLG